MSSVAPPSVALPTATPQFMVAAPVPPAKSPMWTFGLVIILLTLGMLFLINRVKSIDLRMRNLEHVTSNIVTQDDVTEMVDSFVKNKISHMLWTEEEIQAVVHEHVADSLNHCPSAAPAPEVSPVPPPEAAVAPEPPTNPSS